MQLAEAFSPLSLSVFASHHCRSKVGHTKPEETPSYWQCILTVGLATQTATSDMMRKRLKSLK